MFQFSKRIAFVVAVVLLSNSTSVSAQCLAKASEGAFKKGDLLIGLTEGGTHATYITHNTGMGNDGNQQTVLDGDRDPLIIEYGITNYWGVGITIGTDVFDVNPKMYDFETASGKVQAFMSEFTIDANYHIRVSKRVDLSFFGAFGTSSVTFKGNEGDRDYKYNAAGCIARAGGRVRYYLGRFGFMGMVSAFSSSTSPDNKRGSNIGANRTTGITGHAYEFGVCYRLHL